MSTLTQPSLLQSIGDDWHNPRVYESLILSILPATKYARELQDVLVTIYVDEQNNFRLSKAVPKLSQTYFGVEISLSETKIKNLKEDMKKEENHLDSLTVTFAGVEGFVPQEALESEEDDDAEDYTHTMDKGKGNQIKTKAKKISPQEAAKILEQKRKITLAKTTKAAMATSQQKLFDLQKEIALLEKKINYYKHYAYAEFGYLCQMRKLVMEYEKNQDIVELIKGLDSMITYYEMIRRRYVPSAPCSGTYKELCNTHLLHLDTPVYSTKGDLINARCPLHTA